MSPSVSAPPPRGPDSPLAGVAVFTMFRGRHEQLLQWCDFHLAAGASQIYVSLDRPDNSLAGLPQHPRIRWEVVEQLDWDALYPADEQHVERKQVDAFRWTARRARADGHDFLAFVDADELLVLREPFVDIADRWPRVTAFVVPVQEMWFDPGTAPVGPFAATLAVSPSEPGGRGRTRAFGWREQFLSHGMLGHSAGKTVYRLADPLGELTVHRPRSGGGLAARALELPRAAGSVMHFDCGDLATWNAKWGGRLLRDTVARGLWPHRLAQQHLYSHELRRGPREQERFFREFFSLDEEARDLLARDGLMEVFDVRTTVSGPLTQSAQRSSGVELMRLPAIAERVDRQFAMVCDRRFVRPTLATMLSVLVQVGERQSVRFVVLGDGLEGGDVAALRAVEHTKYDVEVMVRDVTSDLDRDVGTQDPKRATFGRMYLIDHLPEQRTIYLDGDVLATRDFSELFTLDLGDACMAGASDSAALRLVADDAGVPVAQRNRLQGITDGDPLDYLNGGVLVLALEHPDFRKLALEARSLVVRRGRALTQRDQDALNIAFQGRKHRLPSTYNYMTQFFVSERVVGDDLERRKYDAADASLIHFSGRIKPWMAPEDEFYNALYRRLVSRAEELTGVSCRMWFSTVRERPDTWRAERWAESLAPWPDQAAVAPASPPPEVEVIAVHDHGLLLRSTSEMHELAVRGQHDLVCLVGSEEVFRVAADRMGPVRTDLLRRVGAGVRHLPVDLRAALAPYGGVVRGLEMVLAAPGRPEGVVRVLGAPDLVATGSGATSDLLAELGVDGALETLRNGWLSGWFRASERPEERVQLLLDGAIVVVRRPDLRGSETDRAAGIKRFTFHVANLRRLGYGSDGEISVRVAHSNVPLHGGSLVVGDLDRDMRCDHDTGAWESIPMEGRRSFSGRVRTRLGRMVRESLHPSADPQ